MSSKKQSHTGRNFNCNSSSGSSGENYSTPIQQEETEGYYNYNDSQEEEDLDLAALRKPGTVYWDPNSPSDLNSRYQGRLANKGSGSRKRIEQTSPSILLGSKERIPPPTIPLQTSRSGTPKKFTRNGSMEELKANFKILDKNQAYSPIKEESKQPKSTITIAPTTATSVSIRTSTTSINNDNTLPLVPGKYNPSFNVGSSNVSESSDSNVVVGDFPDDDEDFDYGLLESTQTKVELEYQNSSKRVSSSGAEAYCSTMSENREPGTNNNSSPCNNDNNSNTSLFEKSCDDPIQSTPSRPKYPRLDSNGRNSIRINISDNNAKPVQQNTITNEAICVGEMMDDDDDDAFLGNLDY